MSEHELGDDLTTLEARLRKWAPVPSRIERDRLIFEAGKQSVNADRNRFSWPLATVASILAAGLLGVSWDAERGRRHALEHELATFRPGVDPAPSAPARPVVFAAEPSSYLALTRSIRVFGELMLAPEGQNGPRGPFSHPNHEPCTLRSGSREFSMEL